MRISGAIPSRTCCARRTPQAIVNANPFDPRVERTSAGTISVVNVAFINADEIETTGLDVSARADFAVADGTLSAWAEATWLFAYDVTNAGVAIDALGKLNRANVGAPNQRLRIAGGLGWSGERIRINAIVRHVGAYEDDGGGDIDGFSTLDASATWSLGALLGTDSETAITLGPRICSTPIRPTSTSRAATILVPRTHAAGAYISRPG